MKSRGRVTKVVEMRMCACVCIHIQHVCTHPTEFDVACSPLPLFALHFKTSLSRNLELSGSARLAGQQTKRIPQHWGDRHNLAALLLCGWHSGLYASACVRVHKCVVGAFVCLPMWRLKVGTRCLPQIALHICGHLVSYSHPLMHTHMHTRVHTNTQTQTYNF